MTRVRGLVDEVDVNRHIPNAAVKDILGVMGKPLGSKDEVPKPRDSRPFFRSVERALEGLNDRVDL